MKHPLYVGHFDQTVRVASPKVTKAVNLCRVRTILLKYCDKNSSGVPLVAETEQISDTTGNRFVGEIGKEEILYKNGYLICPWLGAGVNRTSLEFIRELYDTLEMQVFEPGDCLFYSPPQLAVMMRDFLHAPVPVPKAI